MTKTFKIEIKILENNTPQTWEFSAGISGIEQLALWVILKELAEKQINKLIK